MISCSKLSGFELSRNFDVNFILASNVEQIIEELKTLTLVETTELVSQIETVFGVDASAPVGTATPAPIAPVTPEETPVPEETTFDVMVEDVSEEKRVAVLKVIRKLTSLGLAEAKAFTTSLPKVLKEGVDKAQAEEVKAALEEAGAKVNIN